MAPLVMAMDLVAQIIDEDTAQLSPVWVLIGQGAFLGAVTTVFTLLHKSAVNAYREMVQMNKEIAEVERQRADTVNAQLIELLTPIKQAGEPR